MSNTQNNGSRSRGFSTRGTNKVTWTSSTSSPQPEKGADSYRLKDSAESRNVSSGQWHTKGKTNNPSRKEGARRAEAETASSSSSSSFYSNKQSAEGRSYRNAASRGSHVSNRGGKQYPGTRQGKVNGAKVQAPESANRSGWLAGLEVLDTEFDCGYVVLGSGIEGSTLFEMVPGDCGDVIALKTVHAVTSMAYASELILVAARRIIAAGLMTAGQILVSPIDRGTFCHLDMEVVFGVDPELLVPLFSTEVVQHIDALHPNATAYSFFDGEWFEGRSANAESSVRIIRMRVSYGNGSTPSEAGLAKGDISELLVYDCDLETAMGMIEHREEVVSMCSVHGGNDHRKVLFHSDAGVIYEPKHLSHATVTHSGALYKAQTTNAFRALTAVSDPLQPGKLHSVYFNAYELDKINGMITSISRNLVRRGATPVLRLKNGFSRDVVLDDRWSSPRGIELFGMAAVVANFVMLKPTSFATSHITLWTMLPKLYDSIVSTPLGAFVVNKHKLGVWVSKWSEITLPVKWFSNCYASTTVDCSDCAFVTDGASECHVPPKPVTMYEQVQSAEYVLCNMIECAKRGFVPNPLSNDRFVMLYRQAMAPEPQIALKQLRIAGFSDRQVDMLCATLDVSIVQEDDNVQPSAGTGLLQARVALAAKTSTLDQCQRMLLESIANLVGRTEPFQNPSKYLPPGFIENHGLQELLQLCISETVPVVPKIGVVSSNWADCMEDEDGLSVVYQPRK